MSDCLYYLVIYPIELIVSIVYWVINWICQNQGFAIIGVSLVVNLLSYPLYKRADAIQEEERNKQESMTRWNDHIRHSFKGDERIMMRTAYYKIEHYQPYYALKSSVSLLLQIPFFIAAFHFLSNLSDLQGIRFLMIPDLSAPDNLIRIGGITLNLLPILMTLINFVSSAIYTKDISWRNKWQLYVIAVIFLVLLYDRPSGLVLYWTMNNLFSLLKNILRKLILPFIEKRKTKEKTVKEETGTPLRYREFLPGLLLLAVLMGLLIPSAVVGASPQEFVDADVNTNPLIYVYYTFLVSAGMFLLWFSVFYALATSKAKKILGLIVFCLCGVALADYMFFGRNLGNMSAFLVFDNEPSYSKPEILLNLGIIILIIGAFVFLWYRFRSIVPKILLVGIISLSCMVIPNFVKTNHVIADTGYIRSDKIDVTSDQILTLSKSGKNVVVIMLDRAIGVYAPYIFAEKPKLKEQFSGFTCYPNTISYGRYTNIGTPALFGGYEYTPEEINKRSEETLASKQNEADLVLPVLFSENGFKTTCCDPIYVNYHYAGDLSIFDDYPEIDAYLTRNPNAQPHQQARAEYRKKIFFMYSVFKAAPVLMQSKIYMHGSYCLFLDSDDTNSFQESAFMESYEVLDNLNNMTEITDSAVNTYFSMVNNLPHEPQELQLPDYVPVEDVDNTGLETGERTDENGNVYSLTEARNYHVNMSALLEVGKWLDYLKENGVYDNTRIIIAADHGRKYDKYDQYHLKGLYYTMDVIPLLLYKDFDAKEFTFSDEFMTNADVPTLAVRGLIDDPVNPFTGRLIDNTVKTERPQPVFFSNKWDVLTNNGNTFQEGDWYTVHDNVYDLNNWEPYNPPETP